MPKKIITVFQFDENGWYTQPGAGEWSDFFKEYAMPENSSQIEPTIKEGYWPRFNKETNAWENVKVPTTPEEILPYCPISHTSQAAHDIALRALVQAIAEKYRDTYRLIRGEKDLSWGLEKIPEKTAEELALEAAQLKKSTAQANLAKTDYVAAKIAEGAATKEDYAEVLAQRQVWRDEVNESEKTIQDLQGK